MLSNSTSRWLRGTSLALLVVLGGVGAARADEPAPPAGGAPVAPPAAERLADRGLAALKVRMEAKLKEAELLEKAGKIDEALAAVRDVERLYREGLDELQRLVSALRPPVLLVPPPTLKVPNPADPFSDGIGPEPGLISPSPPTGLFPRRGKALEGQNRDPQREEARANAVLGGLRWLAAHQSENGGWEAAGFHGWCHGERREVGRRTEDLGKPMYDVGVTGLALCAFLGAGYTNRGEHEFTKVVRKGLGYLKQVQDPEGCFGGRTTQHFIYNHAFASLAMLEAYGMTQSPLFKGSAQKALDFIALTRNPYFAWRYGVKPGDNDTSVTGTMTTVLKSARLINEDAQRRGAVPPLAIDEESFDGVRAWIDKMTDPDYGRAGYISRGSGPARPAELVDRFPNDKSEAMTAVAVLMRVFTGEDPAASAVIQKGADLMRKLPPSWNQNDGSIDMYYWYFGALALYQVGGPPWAAWAKALDQAVVRSQRTDGEACGLQGSWDPIDPWGPEGGRVYSTALMTMCLEVETRYERAFPVR